MNKIDSYNKYNCCGCTACATVCKKKAIKMEPDIMGFLYPMIDDDVCVDCGKCLKVCQFKSDYKRVNNLIEPLVYGIRHKSDEELKKSQSGAASWAIIETFLDKSGVVYGAAFDNSFHVVHKRATTIEEAQEFRGSKYVQSDLRGVFESIKTDLLKGERVLFIGTGCQVAGLKAAIPEKYQEKLFTVDLVCHAAPSPSVWEEYIKSVQDKYRSKVISADFRNKKYGWHSHRETFNLANGLEINSEVFKYLFYDHLIIRKSCTKCPFTNLKRVSDMTIGDFWGWEKYYKEWNDNKGVSLLLINSLRGEKFFNVLKTKVAFIKSDPSKCLQPQLIGPSKVNKRKLEEAEEIFRKRGFEVLKTKYSRKSFRYRISHIIPSLTKRLYYRLMPIRKFFNLILNKLINICRL